MGYTPTVNVVPDTVRHHHPFPRPDTRVVQLGFKASSRNNRRSLPRPRRPLELKW